MSAARFQKKEILSCCYLKETVQFAFLKEIESNSLYDSVLYQQKFASLTSSDTHLSCSRACRSGWWSRLAVCRSDFALVRCGTTPPLSCSLFLISMVPYCVFKVSTVLQAAGIISSNASTDNDFLRICGCNWLGRAEQHVEVVRCAA